ncbi:ABC2 membrane 3 and ABC tran domain containing pr otein [Trichuris trichiura]|uniref:ABC2 membrane 3 and ABC tran domain containing pr otein n=1 Tax=Trichuris trichiura TaxID=36087 RepID=A0A077Z2G4_TRITR|nr:ABC2 membrane 3 and ABC tran domain containing pr otein [Trichuris trichiura]
MDFLVDPCRQFCVLTFKNLLQKLRKQRRLIFELAFAPLLLLGLLYIIDVNRAKEFPQCGLTASSSSSRVEQIFLGSFSPISISPTAPLDILSDFFCLSKVSCTENVGHGLLQSSEDDRLLSLIEIRQAFAMDHELYLNFSTVILKAFKILSQTSKVNSSRVNFDGILLSKLFNLDSETVAHCARVLDVPLRMATCFSNSTLKANFFANMFRGVDIVAKNFTGLALTSKRLERIFKSYLTMRKILTKGKTRRLFVSLFKTINFQCAKLISKLNYNWARANKMIKFLRGQVFLIPDSPLIHEILAKINRRLEALGAARSHLEFWLDTFKFLLLPQHSRLADVAAKLRIFLSNLNKSLNGLPDLDPVLSWLYEERKDLRTEVFVWNTLQNILKCWEVRRFRVEEVTDKEKDRAGLLDNLNLLLAKVHFELTENPIGWLNIKGVPLPARNPSTYLEYMELKSIIDYALMEIGTSSAKVEGRKIFAHPWAVERRSQPQLSKNAKEIIITVLFLISLFAHNLGMYREVGYEREHHVREFLKYLGVSQVAYFAAWIASSLIWEMASLCTIYFAFLQFDILTFSNSACLSLLLFAYCISLCCMCCLVVTLSNGVQLSAVSLLLLDIVSLSPWLICQLATGDVTKYVKGISLILPQSTMGWIVKEVLELESKAIGIQWTAFETKAMYSKETSILFYTVLLLVQAFVYFLLTLYFDSVLPDSYGLSKRWNFPFSLLSDYCMHSEEEVPARGVAVKFAGVSTTGSDYVKRADFCNKLNFKICEYNFIGILDQATLTGRTLMLLLSGLLKPSCGKVSWFHSSKRNTVRIDPKSSVLFCPDYSILFYDLSFEENFCIYTSLLGLCCDNKKDELQLNHLLGRLKMKDRMKLYSQELSLGEQNVLSVLIALQLGRRIVVLDNPGLEACFNLRQKLWTLLSQKTKHATIIVSTTFPDVVDRFADGVVVVNGPKVEFFPTVSAFRSWLNIGYRIRFSGFVADLSKDEPTCISKELCKRTDTCIELVVPRCSFEKLVAVCNYFEKKRSSIGFLKMEIFELRTKEFLYPLLSIGIVLYLLEGMEHEHKVALPTELGRTIVLLRSCTYVRHTDVELSKWRTGEWEWRRKLSKILHRLNVSHIKPLTKKVGGEDSDEMKIPLSYTVRYKHAMPESFQKCVNDINNEFVSVLSRKYGGTHKPFWGMEKATAKLRSITEKTAWRIAWQDLCLAMVWCQGLCFICVCCCRVVMEDNITGRKKLLFISSLSPPIYWLSNFIFDLIVYIGVVLLNGCFLLSSGLFVYNNSASLLLNFIILTQAFGACMITLIYVMAKALPFRLVGGVIVFLFFIFAGLVPAGFMISAEYWHFLNAEEMLYLGQPFNSDDFPKEIRQIALLALPPYGLITALMELQVTARSLNEEDNAGTIELFRVPNLLWKSEPTEEATDVEQGKPTDSKDIHNYWDVKFEPDDGCPFNFKRKTLIEDVSICLPYGVCVGLFGHQRSGKSTLCKLLAAMESPTYGNVTFYSVSDTEPPFDQIGYIPHESQLDADLTVMESLTFYAKARCLQDSVCAKVACDMLCAFDLTAIMNRRVEYISEAEKKRLSLAIAFVGGPSIVILDEPTKHLTFQECRRLYQAISSMLDNRTTILIASDNTDFLRCVCRDINVINNGQTAEFGSLTNQEWKYGPTYIVEIKLLRRDQISWLTKFVKERIPHAEMAVYSTTIAAKVAQLSNDASPLLIMQLANSISQSFAVDRISIYLNSLNDILEAS